MKNILTSILFCLSFSSNANILPPVLSETFEYRESGDQISAAPLQTSNIERINAGTGTFYDRADLYGFRWDGGEFIADTRWDTRYSWDEEYNSDSVLSLFDKNGNFIVGNDNWDTRVIYAKIQLELPYGFYYIGVSQHVDGFEIDDISDYKLLAPNTGISYLLNKTVHFDSFISNNAIVNDEFPTQIPEPNILFILGVGLLGVYLTRKIKRS